MQDSRSASSKARLGMQFQRRRVHIFRVERQEVRLDWGGRAFCAPSHQPAKPAHGEIQFRFQFQLHLQLQFLRVLDFQIVVTRVILIISKSEYQLESLSLKRESIGNKIIRRF